MLLVERTLCLFHRSHLTVHPIISSGQLPGKSYHGSNQALVGREGETAANDHVWQLSPSKFTITNPQWPQHLQSLLDVVKVELGCGSDGKIACELSKLLLCEPGRLANRLTVIVVTTLIFCHEKPCMSLLYLEFDCSPISFHTLQAVCVRRSEDSVPSSSKCHYKELIWRKVCI